MRRRKRTEYVKMRKAYKVAVSRAKRKYDELDGLLSNHRRWWRKVQKMGVMSRGGKRDDDITKVYNEVGEVIEGEEAVGVWKRHFEHVLNVFTY